MLVPWYTDPIRPIPSGCRKYGGGYWAVGPANIDHLEVHAEYEDKNLGFVHVCSRLLVCQVCPSRKFSHFPLTGITYSGTICSAIRIYSIRTLLETNFRKPNSLSEPHDLNKKETNQS
jgi:hypothetical protein